MGSSSGPVRRGSEPDGRTSRRRRSFTPPPAHHAARVEPSRSILLAVVAAGGGRLRRSPGESRRKARPQPRALAATIATMPARTNEGRSGHAATTAARSGSVGFTTPAEAPNGASLLPDLLPPESEAGVFPAGSRDSSNPHGVISGNGAVLHGAVFLGTGAPVRCSAWAGERTWNRALPARPRNAATSDSRRRCTSALDRGPDRDHRRGSIGLTVFVRNR